MSRNRLAMMLYMGLAGAFDPNNKEFLAERETRKVHPKGTLYRTSKQGQQVFTYPDGFSCSALNKKSADKKYNRFLKSKED